MPKLYSNDLDVNSFVNFIEKMHFNELPLIMAFSNSKAVFKRYKFDKTFLSETDNGRIFSPEGELKWRRIDNHMRVVYLGNQEQTDGLNDYSSEIYDYKTKYSNLILWGIRIGQQKEWFEHQVPNLFPYPVTEKKYSKGRVAIVVESFIDSTGNIQFSRYFDIKEIPDSAKKTQNSRNSDKKEIPGGFNHAS
ncbi:hypothetical protein MHK_000778 [Candidatus Magnetomorum sp. HK-1]|nr:hypothetical protein MHK_000778 [Candidatus Magnetomorum sp. HK-1]